MHRRYNISHLCYKLTLTRDFVKINLCLNNDLTYIFRFLKKLTFTVILIKIKITHIRNWNPLLIYYLFNIGLYAMFKMKCRFKKIIGFTFKIFAIANIAEKLTLCWKYIFNESAIFYKNWFYWLYIGDLSLEERTIFLLLLFRWLYWHHFFEMV